ncbi:hypothetical protein AVEN_224129-1 [Araneus ventricosus]|uniref:Uncharacterized protein n=1 Tax=Araneus ventricosus TaxID=182803 RepID=A0A4Y2IF24_ARAVE|nr:hypothetical protein AVEN_224129-1 [Araneus ventricosus]
MSDAELQTYFEFELTQFPLSLFDEGGLRKTRKSVFYDLFSTTTVVHFTSACYVVDGAFLLRRVLCQEKESFSFILKKNVDYAKKHFKEGASIIFYGYPEDAEKSTKLVERIRRTKKHIAGYVMFDELLPATMSQEKFLSNDKNKQRLISMICVKFQKEGFVVKQVQKDADYLIIKSALEIEKSSQFVVVVGEDIDLLVIMTASTNSENIFCLKPGKDKAGDALYCAATLSIAPHNKGQYFVSSCVQWLRYHICSFQAGKKKFMNVLNSTELQYVVKIFRDKNSCPDEIDEVGQKVLIALYGVKN